MCSTESGPRSTDFGPSTRRFCSPDVLTLVLREVSFEFSGSTRFSHFNQSKLVAAQPKLSLIFLDCFYDYIHHAIEEFFSLFCFCFAESITNFLILPVETVTE